MIIHTEGDILRTRASTIVNRVNLVGVMGAGLAKTLAESHPGHLRPYQAACKNGSLKIGKTLYWKGPSVAIICLPTKRHWRDRSSLSDIEKGLAALADEIKARSIPSVAVPALGCGLGQLRWKPVREAIETALRPVAENCDIELYGPGKARGPNRGGERP